MQYALLIYENEKAWINAPQAEQEQIGKAYWAFTQEIQQSGHHRAGQGLQPVSTATTVRLKEGKTLTTDGPFAETKEQLAGFYLVEAKDLDEAVVLAARIPAVRSGGCIEVRPLRVAG